MLFEQGFELPDHARAATYFSKTPSELFLLVGQMTLFAYALAAKHGYDFPLTSGRLIETGPGKYQLEDGPAGGEPPEGAAP